jgi:L-ascorbate metabolism protein UlaG (beta-lactamase superfamily)
MQKYPIVLLFYLFIFQTMSYSENKPYHHITNEKGETIEFRNPIGSPVRGMGNWSFSKFNKEKKKMDMTIREGHVISKKTVLENLKNFEDKNYILWIGHATFLIKLGNTTIITDPLFSKNTGPFIFGPKRYVEPAIELDQLPETNLLLLTHNHYDHLDYSALKDFPFKNTLSLVPLKLGKYFSKNNFHNIKEMDWYEEVQYKDLNITFIPAVHWSKRSLTDANKTLWGSFIIEYKGKKILFACDTGYGEIYKDLGKKYGPIDLLLINTGAYNFKAMGIEKSIYHTTPEEALQIGKDIKARKVLSMHWGTVVLSLEPIMEPPKRFKENAKNYGYKDEDVINFKIGEIRDLESLLN